jgi:FkbH-like protein
MKYFIFRNATVERFFQHLDAAFSGYEDVSEVDETADRYVWLYLPPVAAAGSAATAEKIRYYADLVRMTAERVPAGKMFIVCTIKNIFTIRSISSDRAVADAVCDYNAALYALAARHGNVKVVDFAQFFERYPSEELIDWKYYFISQMALNPRIAGAFQEWFAAQIQAIELKRKKCLALDLDNTLWGGVLGEDGVSGVALGGDYPGKAFLFFQQQILELSRQGVILAASSKNNLEDVRQLWREHPDAALKEEHFAALRIDWSNKADNLRDMAQELNIGLDSFVFLDDSPSERELIKRYLPEVAVPDFPEQPYLLPAFFKNVAEQHFAAYALTDEDRVKTEQYRANALRASAQQAFASMDEYIRSLDIALKVAEANDLSLSRAAQMTQKTNQFNLTTRRYTDADLKDMLHTGHRIFTLSVSDRFGDSGLTGACIVKVERDKAAIDSLLLSCRILGKDIEYAFIKHILKTLQSEGIVEASASYIPTAKNSQVAEFYERVGFDLKCEDEEQTKYYKIDLSKISITLSSNYKFT